MLHHPALNIQRQRISSLKITGQGTPGRMVGILMKSETSLKPRERRARGSMAQPGRTPVRVSEWTTPICTFIRTATGARGATVTRRLASANGLSTPAPCLCPTRPTNYGPRCKQLTVDLRLTHVWLTSLARTPVRTSARAKPDQPIEPGPKSCH